MKQDFQKKTFKLLIKFKGFIHVNVATHFWGSEALKNIKAQNYDRM